MKVLVLTSTLPAEPGDGTPEFVLTLAMALSPSCSVTILAPRVRDAVARVEGVTITRFPYFPARWERLAEEAILPRLRKERWRIVEAISLTLRFIWTTAVVVRRERPDVVHAHWLVPGGLAAVIAKRLFGVPFVVTVHGADAYSLRGLPFDRIRTWVIRQASEVVPVSTDIAATLGLAADPVPMGVDVRSIRSMVGTRSPESGRLLFVGRLAEKKGVDVAIEALTALPDARLEIVGDGPERPHLERLAASYGVTERVTFHGRCRRDAVMAHLKRAELVVIPSVVAGDGDMDGTPVVFAEAVAAGVPVVASRIGGLAAHDDHDAGILVTPGSARELADAIQTICASPRNDWGRQTRAQLDIGITAQKYVDSYRRAAAP